MSYLVTNPKEETVDLMCKGCGADLTVTYGWEFINFDQELQLPSYVPAFVSVSCSANPDYGCICVELETQTFLAPDYLLREIEDMWSAQAEKWMEKYH